MPKLLGLDGVANISTFGQADRQLQVQVDPAKLAAQHVTLAQVIETAGNSQLVSPITYLQGSAPGTGGYIEGSNQRLDIRHILPFGTPGNMTGLPIAGSTKTTIGDVAQVVTGHQPLIGDAEVHGTQGLVLVIQKLPGASVPQITREVRQALAQLAPGMPGVTVDTSLFQASTYTNTATDNLRTAAIIAAVLAALALLLLLLSLRAAFVAVVSIAVSLSVALILLFVMGYTLNALVLLGLLLALGLVVADAASGGFVPGMGAGLIVAALAAVPLLVSSGTTASFLRPMAVAYLVAVAASVIIAAGVSAALDLAAIQRRPAAAAAPRSRRSRAGWRAATPARCAASAGCRALVVPALCAVVGIAVIAGIPFLHPGQPTFADRNLVVQWTGSPSMSLTEMNRVATLASQRTGGDPRRPGRGRDPRAGAHLQPDRRHQLRPAVGDDEAGRGLRRHAHRDQGGRRRHPGHPGHRDHLRERCPGRRAHRAARRRRDPRVRHRLPDPGEGGRAGQVADGRGQRGPAARRSSSRPSSRPSPSRSTSTTRRSTGWRRATSGARSPR